MKNYKAYIKEVHNHDTVTAVVEQGSPNSKEIKLQLYGMNCQEKGGKLGMKDILSDLILGREVEVFSHKSKKGKKRNKLATLLLDGLDVNQWLSQMTTSEYAFS